MQEMMEATAKSHTGKKGHYGRMLADLQPV
jgi:hypothetical protein